MAPLTLGRACMMQTFDMPPADVTAQFRLAMRSAAATVYLITAMQKGQRFGITATAVTSLSFDPLSLLVCVNQNTSLYNPLLAAERFGVTILSEQQADIAHQFGTVSMENKRFGLGQWEERGGVPILIGALSSIICQRRTHMPYGTHTIVVGDVIHAQTQPGVWPLVYRDGRYVSFANASAIEFSK